MILCMISVGKFHVEIKSFEKVRAFPSSFVGGRMSHRRILFNDSEPH